MKKYFTLSGSGSPLLCISLDIDVLASSFHMTFVHRDVTLNFSTHMSDSEHQVLQLIHKCVCVWEREIMISTLHCETASCPPAKLNPLMCKLDSENQVSQLKLPTNHIINDFDQSKKYFALSVKLTNAFP